MDDQAQGPVLPGQKDEVAPWMQPRVAPAPQRSRWMWFGGGVVTGTVLTALAGFLSGFVGPDERNASVAASTPSPAAHSSESPSAPSDPPADATSAASRRAGPDVTVGEAVENDGTMLTVTGVSSPATISVNRSGYETGSQFAELTDDPPPAGGKFVVVETKVENTGETSQDLTCGWPIEIYAIDADGRRFDPVDSLYEYVGNPECNAQLQPGFTSPMVWPFVVPEDAEITQIVFRDTDGTDPDGFSVISVSKQN